jgi:hypothetical protein
MEKFDSFFGSLNISESSLQNIKKINLIQTPVYTFVNHTCSIHLYYYAFLTLKTLKFQEKRATIVNISCKKSCFEKRWKFLSSYNNKKRMSAEDDIFLAEASPIANRGK